MTLAEKLKNALLSAKELGTKDELNEDEARSFDAVVAEIEAIKVSIKAKEDRSAKMAAIEAAGADLEARLAQPATKPVNMQEKGNVVVGEDRGLKFESMGEFLQDVMVAATKREISPKLKEVRAAQGANTLVNSEGGYLVQQDFAKEIYESVREIGSEVISRTDLIGIKGNGMKIPTVSETTYAGGIVSGGVLAYWGAEAAALTKSQPVFGELSLSLNKVHALVYASEEMLEDSAAIEGFIHRKAPMAINFAVENAFINGSGVGQPLGLLNSAGLVTVAKEAGQAAQTVVVENIFKMFSRMKPSSLKNSVWYISQNILPQLLGMQIGNQPVFIPGGVVANAPYGMLLGRPIIPIEYCATLGTIGDIVFADMSDYAAIDKGGIKAATSIHVEFLTDQTAFRYTYRVDGKHKMASAITPANGGDSFSSAVTLATRA